MTPLVSVIVPAYNSERFIERTLASAVAQTYGNLEILVVDDGSVDATSSIVRRMMASDSRLKLLDQANAGVAAARNRALAAAGGEFVAPLDADDLWHPTKIEKQVSLMMASQAKVGVVYCWSSLIDESDRIRSRYCSFASSRGNVYVDLLLGNILGNASTPLIRASLARRVGAYDPGLRARGGQGAEDLDFYLRLAEACEFAVVPEFLVGYRQRPGSMSMDVRQMQRSLESVMAQARRRNPGIPRAIFRWHRGQVNEYLARLCWAANKPFAALGYVTRSALIDPARVPTVVRSVISGLGRKNPSSAANREFLALPPAELPVVARRRLDDRRRRLTAKLGAARSVK